MITFANLQQHDNRPFSEYLGMGGYSHSFLKYSVNGVMPHIEATEKMRFGSLVDAILTNQRADITDPRYNAAKHVAAYLAAKYPYLAKFKKQVPCTGTASYGGLSMRMKSLVDFVLPSFATIELKVTDSKNIEALIEYMAYDNQCYIERSLAGVSKSFILVYSTTLPKDKNIYFRERSCDNSPAWLVDKIMQFGSVLPPEEK